MSNEDPHKSILDDDNDDRAQLQAISRSQAVIEFSLDGTIVRANDNFLSTVGYDADEIVGHHHSIFVDESTRRSPEYEAFWERLRQGQYDAGEYRRLAKGGREIWIRASYNPVFDGEGRPIKVVKFASDITTEKLRSARSEGMVAAIDRSQAVIEFEMDGTIITANENFLDVMGYTIDEIRGHHHRIFVEPSERESQEYTAFWTKLNRGEFDGGEYLRLGKGGKEVWIQATYNPIFDASGRPIRVVKFASDVSERVELQAEVNRVVEEIIRVAQALGSGDLTQTMTGDCTGRFADLQRVFNGFIDSMAATLWQTKTATITMGEATTQLRRSSEHLAQGAAEQQRACQVSSESLVETSAMAEATSTNAGRANDLAELTNQAAEAGHQRMQALTDAMAGIAQSSSEISKIIKVIDEIAFQTNLLAVNAAVEAARAGRHGRGFAVVAQEVRSLAGRSSKAAQATAELIEKSSATVDRGVNNVDDTAKALDEIRENVVKVRNIVSEITEASAEQSRGVSEVRRSMDEVNASAASASQQSAELAAAANNLASQSGTLSEAVARFKLRPPSSSVVDDGVVSQIASLLGIDAGALAQIMASRGLSVDTPAKVEALGAVADAAAPAANAMGDRDKRGFGSF